MAQVIFKNRTEAAERLLSELSEYATGNSVILAIPKGGIPMGCVLAEKLGLPLDLVLAKKLGHPVFKECAIGAVGLYDHFVNPHALVSPKYISEQLKTIRNELLETHRKFYRYLTKQSLTGKTIIVTDDGMASGISMLEAVRIIRKSKPDKIIVAIPVASAEAVGQVAKYADSVIVLAMPQPFEPVSYYYEDFTQVSDRAAINGLKSYRTISKRPVER